MISPNMTGYNPSTGARSTYGGTSLASGIGTGLGTILGGPIGGALVGGGISLLGNLLDDSPEKELAERRKELAQQQANLDREYQLKKLMYDESAPARQQSVGVTGMGLLNSMKNDALKNQKFREAALKVMTGGQNG